LTAIDLICVSYSHLDVKPDIVIESVPGLLAPCNDTAHPALAVAHRLAYKCGYRSVACGLVDFSAAGMLQRRKRVVIVASDRYDAPTLLYGRPKTNMRSIRSEARQLDAQRRGSDEYFQIIDDGEQRSIPKPNTFPTITATNASRLVMITENGAGRIPIHMVEMLQSLPSGWTALDGISNTPLSLGPRTPPSRGARRFMHSLNWRCCQHRAQTASPSHSKFSEKPNQGLKGANRRTSHRELRQWLPPSPPPPPTLSP